jgi:hypothetical protein
MFDRCLCAEDDPSAGCKGRHYKERAGMPQHLATGPEIESCISAALSLVVAAYSRSASSAPQYETSII